MILVKIYQPDGTYFGHRKLLTAWCYLDVALPKFADRYCHALFHRSATHEWFDFDVEGNQAHIYRLQKDGTKIPHQTLVFKNAEM